MEMILLLIFFSLLLYRSDDVLKHFTYNMLLYEVSLSVMEKIIRQVIL